jgi:hypothetical protein
LAIPILPSIHKAFTGWLEPHWVKMERSPERNRVNFLRHSDIYHAVLVLSFHNHFRQSVQETRLLLHQGQYDGYFLFPLPDIQKIHLQTG